MNFFRRIFSEARSKTTKLARDPALLDWLFPRANSATGVVVTWETALSCPAVGACVRLLSDTIATVPLDLYRRLPDGSREKAAGDPRHDLLHRAPNDYQTSVDFRRTLMMALCTAGNAYARIGWSANGTPSALTPLSPRRMRPYFSNGAVWYRHDLEAGGQEIIAASDVLHVRGPWHSFDGLVALSPIDTYRETIGLAMGVVEYLARFFSNSAVPQGAIEIPGVISQDAAERIRKSWEQRYKGLENAHRIAILDGGMKIHQLGATNRDAQMVETYRSLVSEIAGQIYGVPPHMIGETDKQTSWGSGVEQQTIGFLSYVARPYYVAIEAALNRALTSEASRDLYFEFNVEGLLRGDFKTRMEGYALAIQWGIATPNEVRARENMPTIEGGDDRLVPLNMAPADLVRDVLVGDPAEAARALRTIAPRKAA